MHTIKGVVLSMLIAHVPRIVVAQNIVSNPTASQTITQPANTNFIVQASTILQNASNVNNVLWVDGVKYTTILGCYSALPSTGGSAWSN